MAFQREFGCREPEAARERLHGLADGRTAKRDRDDPSGASARPRLVREVILDEAGMARARPRRSLNKRLVRLVRGAFEGDPSAHGVTRVLSERESAGPEWARGTSYRIKVTLTDVEPLVWRRFVVSGRMAASDLRPVVLRVMGWRGGHMDGVHFPRPWVQNGRKALLSERLQG